MVFLAFRGHVGFNDFEVRSLLSVSFSAKIVRTTGGQPYLFIIFDMLGGIGRVESQLLDLRMIPTEQGAGWV
jgi:hypothetical protein